jgi:hypothetical protein
MFALTFTALPLVGGFALVALPIPAQRMNMGIGDPVVPAIRIHAGLPIAVMGFWSSSWTFYF